MPQDNHDKKTTFTIVDPEIEYSINPLSDQMLLNPKPKVMLQGSVVLKKIFGQLSECSFCSDALIISQISILSGSGTSASKYNNCPARVAMDIEKSFESYIASCSAEYAAVDLYSAAGISCLKKGNCLYTNSDAFRNSGFYKEDPESFERVAPPFENSLWQSAIKNYANALLKVFPKEKIILLRLKFSDTAVKQGEVRSGPDRNALNRRIREMEEFFISLVNPNIIDIAGDYFADGEDSSPSAFEPLFYADAAAKFKEIIFGNGNMFYFTQGSPEYRIQRAVKYYDSLSARAFMSRMFNIEKAADAIIMYSSKAFAAENSVSLIKLMKKDVRGLLNAAEFLKNDISAEELVRTVYAIDAILKNDLSHPYDFYSVVFRRKMNILKLMAKQLSQITGRKTDKDNAEIVFLLKDAPEDLEKYFLGLKRIAVDIWGSCVSRESVNCNKKDIIVWQYIFKQMHLLAFENPLEYPVPKDDKYFNSSSWRRRTIADSFGRSGINTLSSSKSEWIIVDFYDLICEAVIFKGQLLEVDNFVKRTDFYKSISSECKSTYLFDYYSEEFCRDNMKRFAEFIKKRYGNNVILIKIDLKDSYISLDDRLEKLNDNDGRLSDRRKFVDFCEKLFAELTDCYVIDIARCFYASDRFPLGGAHIVHYEDKFYSETCRIITEILGGSQQKYYGSVDDNELMLRNLLLNR